MAHRSGVYAVAVLGALSDGPLHGYELRRRLTGLLGSLRAFSYGSLYPCLRTLLEAGWIEEDRPAATTAARGNRPKIVYRLTAAGESHFAAMINDAGPASWEDDGFGVRFAFFRHAASDVRLRILEGRRSRLEERLLQVKAALARTRDRLDTYTLELQRHGLESAEREARWVTELIADERQRGERSTTGNPLIADERQRAEPPTYHPSRQSPTSEEHP